MNFFTVLDTFKTVNSLANANAKKIRAHIRRHPMVMCMLTEDDAHIVREAVALAEKLKPEDVK